MVWKKTRYILKEFSCLFWQCLKGHYYSKSTPLHSQVKCILGNMSLKYTEYCDCESGAVELHGFMSWLGFTTTTSHLLHSAVIFFIAHLWLHFNHILLTMIAVDFYVQFFSPQSHLCKQQALHFKNLDILVTILQSFQLQKKSKN